MATGIGGPVQSLASFNDGAGPALYAGGGFGSAGTVPAAFIIRWNGQAFSAVGAGTTAPVITMAASASSGVLVAGGTFQEAGNASAGRLAVWHGCPYCFANCDGSTEAPVLTPNDFLCFLNAYAQALPGANCDGSTGLPALTPNDFLCFINEYAGGCPQ